MVPKSEWRNIQTSAAFGLFVQGVLASYHASPNQTGTVFLLGEHDVGVFVHQTERIFDDSRLDGLQQVNSCSGHAAADDDKFGIKHIDKG